MPQVLPVAQDAPDEAALLRLLVLPRPKTEKALFTSWLWHAGHSTVFVDDMFRTNFSNLTPQL